MSLDSMVKAAEANLGMGEPNKIQDWYRQRNGPDYAGNFAWCDAGITYESVIGGEYDAVCFGKDFAYTVWHAQAFEAHGQWHHGMDGIQRGDIVFFDWDMAAPGQGQIGNIDHVELVTGTQGDYALTIGCNTQDVCARRVRDASTIVGYGRPNYSTAPAPAPAPVPTALPGLQHSINRVLVNYTEGDDVYEFQRYMHDVRGWSGLVKDGKYGDQSERYCRLFQEDSSAHGWPLTVDGKAGPKTIYAMTHRSITR